MATTDNQTRYLPENAPERPENPILDRRAWTKMWLENNNTIWTVVGDTGDGKSYASLRIGEVLDPNFTIDNVAFNMVDFLEKALDDSYGQGSVIVLEEGSVEASSYDWHSKSNRIFAKILDTWRHQNRMGIFNLPNFKTLEKGARRRTKGIVKMQHAVPWLDYSQGKFYDANYGNIEDDLTTPFSTIDGKERRYIRFKMPSEDLRQDFEEISNKDKKETGRLMLEELLETKKEEEETELKPKEIAQDIIDEDKAIDYVNRANNGQIYVKQELIEMDYDIGGRKGKKVKAALERELELEKVIQQ